MILPKKDSDGKYYVSYSQIKMWNETKGFSTGKLGRIEYIQQYFFGDKYEDKGGFGQFGIEVENYITTKKDEDKFTQAEKDTLDKISPLGIFQKEFKLNFKDFYVWGFIDDMTEKGEKIRDYKTASEKSSQKYYEDDYNQLDVYSLAIKQDYGKLPKELEVCVIERLGNGFRGGRNAMSVGERVWYIPRKTTKERLKTLENSILSTTKQISEYYEVFLTLNK